MVFWTAPVATDNSKSSPNVTCNAENGTKFEIGEKEVMCQGVDQAGNQATCLFIVDVVGKEENEKKFIMYKFILHQE